MGLGSVGADLHLISEQGNGLGGTEGDLPGGAFFDLIWEQNLTVADPLAEGVSPERWAALLCGHLQPNNGANSLLLRCANRARRRRG